jgi:hypothetical protein
MNLPFTAEQFFGVFARYNQSVWPAQIALNALALTCIGLVFLKSAAAGRWISALLAALWFWVAVAYHFAFFSRINPAAWVFGGVTFAGGLVFLWIGTLKGTLRFAPAGGWRGASGAALVVYALLVYPLLGYLIGHRYPGAPTFGVPCPTTIFTLGLLLFASPPAPRLAFVAPVLWAGIGSIAAFSLGIVEDLGLLVAGIVALVAARSAAGAGMSAAAQTLKAGALYFALVFGAGFVLGALRVLLVVPHLGARTAELIEAPFMLAVTVLAARWTVRRLSVPPAWARRLAMGAVALGVLLAAEFTAVLELRGLSLREYFATLDPVAGTVYYALLGVFALMPVLVARR